MQGKERNQNSEIDKQYVDMAWSNMSELLDREMPVVAVSSKSKNKRYLTLLLLLMIGFLLGIGSMAVFSEQQEVPVVQPSVTPMPSKIPSNIPVADATIPLNTKEVEPVKNIGKQANTIETKSATKIISSPPSSKNLIAKTNNGIVSTNSKQSVIGLKQNKQKISIESLPFQANEKIEEPSIVYSEFYKKQKNKNQLADQSLLNLESGGVVKEEVIIDIEKESSTVITENVLPASLGNYLATAGLLELPSGVMGELDAKAPTIESEFVFPKISSWRLAAIGGMHMTGGYAGWEAGLLAEYKLNPRFAIQSGLTLRSLKKDTYLDIYNSTTNDYENPDGSIGFIDPTIGDIGNNNLEGVMSPNQAYLSRLNYVNTPLVLSYQPTSFMKILLGMNLAYRFDFVDQVIGDNANKSDDNRVSEMTSPLSQELASNSLTNGIRKMDVSGVFGIGFYPTKNTGIDLRYHLGFQDYTDDAYFTTGKVNNNRSLQLSLIHYFGR